MIGAKNEKRCKKCLPCLIVLLFVIGTIIAPATAKKENKLAIIDEKLEAIDDDPTINSFIYNRMLEYDNPALDITKGLKAVKVVVIDDHWWSDKKGHWWPGKKEVETFYVVRNDGSKQIDIVHTYAGDGSKLWTFYPNVGQTISALDIVIKCFEDCVSCKKAVHNLIRLGMLVISVDKKNVPGITEIITKSPWLNNYLPEWAKKFLERFDRHH